MKIKRGFSLFFACLLVFIIIPFVFALDPGSIVQSSIQSFSNVATPIFSALFGLYQSDEFLFTKVLLFILLFVIVKVGLKATPRLGEQNGIVNIIALVVSLFAIRYISENNLTKGILLPYGALGVALVTIAPFIVYFFCVEKFLPSTVGRKAAWLLFTLVFVILWISRAGSPEGLSDVANYMYMGVVILGVILFFFDKSVRVYFGRQASKANARNSLERRLLDLLSSYRSYADLEGDIAERQRREILRQIRKIEEDLHKL